MNAVLTTELDLQLEVATDRITLVAFTDGNQLEESCFFDADTGLCERCESFLCFVGSFVGDGLVEVFRLPE